MFVACRAMVPAVVVRGNHPVIGKHGMITLHGIPTRPRWPQVRLLLLCCSVVGLWGCVDTPEQAARPKVGDTVEAIVGPDGAALVLTPRVLVEGVWQDLADHSAATVPMKVAMKAADGGFTVQLHYTPVADTTVQGLELKGHVKIVAKDVKGWISNGFQSWSQSGVVALGEPKSDKKLGLDLSITGDGETIRKGDSLSWWGTSLATNAHSMTVGVVTARRWKSAVSAYKAGEHVGLRLISGWTGEQIAVKAGESVSSALWFVAFDDLEAWPKAMKARHPYNKLVAAEAGWNSWYELWDGVTATDVLQNAAIAKKMLTPLVAELPKHGIAKPPSLRIVVDDGWQKNWGDWQPNSKFPDGLDGLAKKLHADGFEVGVWLAPLLASESSDVYKAHPEWFVKGPTFGHLKIGTMHVLDPTHPQAAAHLGKVIKGIVGWGYTLLKIDFLFAGTWEGKRHKDVTGVEAYNTALKIMREAAGDKAMLLAVGAPALPTIEHVDMWRVGGDIAVEPFKDPHFAFVANQLRMIASRWQFCRRVLCDADPAMLRAMPANEVNFGAWVVGLAGGGFFLSDDLRKLPDGRREWPFQLARDVAPALSGQVTVPSSTFPDKAPATLVNAAFDHLEKKSRHVVPVVWPNPGGLIGANVTDAPITAKGQAIPAHTIILLK
jgi:hypothetical protein